MVMAQMVRELMQDQHTNQIVSQSDYQQWAAGFVFEALREQRYGQSFCRKFNIRDNILYYSTTVSDADRYIQENYVR
jgi:hypothetical protein